LNLVSLEIFPVTLAFIALYWLLPRRPQLYFLVASTAAFLIYQGYESTFMLLSLLTGASYLCANRLGDTFGTKTVALLGVAAIAAFLFLYKLTLQLVDFQFFIVGASYFSLRLIHYLIESSRKKLPSHDFIEFVAYCFFLPTFFVGPINRFGEFVRDERRRRWDYRLFHTGLERILFGYFKVMVLANYLVDVKLATYIESIGGEATAAGAWLLCVEYGLDLYFRFGGYCDVAIGISALLGFRILENFNYPFIRKNIGAFWQSWNISLSSWCRDYIFTPAAYTLRSPSTGVLLSMLVLGIWHEVSLRYIVWGLYHGVGIIVFQFWVHIKARWSLEGVLPGYFSVPLGVIITFNFVILSFAITRTESLMAASEVFRTILGVD
jgi:alginate O-acetyltransferase complex protein AlgI